MNNKISDEQIDLILKALLQARALDDAEIDEIADSPKIWRQIKNQIGAEKAKAQRFSFFENSRQIFAFGALAALICFGIFGWMALNRDNQEIARQQPVTQAVPIDRNLAVGDSSVMDITKTSGPAPPETAIIAHQVTNKPTSKTVPAVNQVRPMVKRSEKLSQRVPALTASATIIEPDSQPFDMKGNNKPDEKDEIKKEIKSDFIALSYSPSPESGQLVKVKVPRSMMVSLGVTNDVENGSELVNAEVVVGDDGLAHSIRFVR